ncbi:MAG: ArsR family transcriptional regulator [Adlercreutzia sp.]|nr:ArsR family transcriptional regulator [Adlercreutzia sp.]
MAAEDYTPEEFNREHERIMRDLLTAYAPHLPEKPQAYLLGGQSGAGKTTLHKMIRQRTPGGIISINGDDYRKKHPRFLELQRLHGDKAVDYTAPWAGRMTEALVEALSAIGYNLIIEGTLRTAEVPLKTAMLLRERGYGVSLALMAVKPDISLVSCQLRYEEMRIAGTTPRATDPAHHKKIVDQIVSNLRTLEESQQFEEIYLYTRAQRCLYPREGYGGTASDTLKEALFGPWTEEERRHYEHLKAKLLALQAREAPESLRVR